MFGLGLPELLVIIIILAYCRCSSVALGLVALGTQCQQCSNN
jgi:hypothetical protein